MKWYLMTKANGERYAYAGIKLYGAIEIPCHSAIHWKWSNGSYCFY